MQQYLSLLLEKQQIMVNYTVIFHYVMFGQKEQTVIFPHGLKCLFTESYTFTHVLDSIKYMVCTFYHSKTDMFLLKLGPTRISIFHLYSAPHPYFRVSAQVIILYLRLSKTDTAMKTE